MDNHEQEVTTLKLLFYSRRSNQTCAKQYYTNKGRICHLTPHPHPNQNSHMADEWYKQLVNVTIHLKNDTVTYASFLFKKRGGGPFWE
jgi:hypothetical protein